MINIRKLSTADADFSQSLADLLAIESAQDIKVTQTVNQILADVKTRGDAALMQYTRQFDQRPSTRIDQVEISYEQAQAALRSIDQEARTALEFSAARIREYHEKQVATSWQHTGADGTMLGQKITALASAGLYVPGGKAAYPSSVLMNAIPAKVAGVENLIMVTPAPGGHCNPLVLAAAVISGVNRIFTIGGAQAIGALAYGTETIPRVDKIVGPGNAYVAAAKRQVFGTVGIDMIAGPSEILIICDGQTNPDWIAMDLFSQAEHDEQAQSILLCPDTAFLELVATRIADLIETMPRHEVIRTSLQNRGALIQVRNLQEACEIANHIAPEHLELSVENPGQWVDEIKHAGAIFLGRHTCEALGDYCAGPNHVLPTSGTARFSSPLGVYDFQKRTSLIQVSPSGAMQLGRVAATLARGEGLEAHAKSASYRYDH
ncbi:MAG: histidinol dehydrogenase [Nitrosomonas sp.]|nr:histidinol dehydrogenase [Nitrosomonas sp.]